MSEPAKNDLVLRAARGERTERTPVWLMRQAGRFDPQYLALRERADLPLEALFRSPSHAVEISLLPKRFGVDAIIFFQDILTPLAPMGAEFVFRPGPKLINPPRTAADVEALRLFDPSDALPFVADTLGTLKRELAGALPLLGFAGAPLTLAFFLIEGRSPGRAAPCARALMKAEPGTLHKLLERLADMTAAYLAYQIDSGADAVQLFESCADLFSEAEYLEFAHPYHVRIFQQLGDRVPRILFAREQPQVELMAESHADVLSVGGCVDLAAARRKLAGKVALQGNVDNMLLATGTPEAVVAATKSCIRAGGHTGHILNLSHGLLKDTPVENVQALIRTCHETVLTDECSTAGTSQ